MRYLTKVPALQILAMVMLYLLGKCAYEEIIEKREEQKERYQKLRKGVSELWDKARKCKKPFTKSDIRKFRDTDLRY